MIIAEQLSGPVSSLFTLRLAVPVVLLTLFFLWETWQPFFGHSHRLRHAGQNLGLTIFNAVLLALTFSSLTFYMTQWVSLNQYGLLNLAPIGAGVAFVLSLVLLDAWMYIWHRANHAIPFLWRFHRMHHSDNKMDVTSASRFHIGEHVLSSGLRLCLIPIIGLSIWHLVSYEILVIAVTQLHHADISLGRFDRWLRVVIVTPDMHKVHHSRWKPETDSNYSSVLSIWDRIARSFRMRPDVKSIKFGLNDFDDPQWQTVRGMLVTPFRSNESGETINDDVHDE